MIRVTFNLGTTFDPFVKSPSSIFLKELSFRCVWGVAGERLLEARSRGCRGLKCGLWYGVVCGVVCGVVWIHLKAL